MWKMRYKSGRFPQGGHHSNASYNMFIKSAIVLVVVVVAVSQACLITNCPRGGKRSGKFGLQETTVKPCISCGPGRLGQCFGPSICCGPFGCLFGTQDTARCQRDGFFHERQPCIAGNASCRKNTGRCAGEGICCSQDSCYTDRSCASDEKPHMQDNILPVDLYNFMNAEYGPES